MNETERSYCVNEIFVSLQGEGFHTGRPAVFLRLSGCNRRCPFCDTQHLDPATPMTAPEIVKAVSVFRPRFLVVTGGEPLLQLDKQLVDALKKAGFTIAVETNGSLPVPAGVDWVTCSPKEKPWTLDEVDELKVVFTSAAAVEDAAAHFQARHRFIQPLYDAETGSTNARAVVDYLLQHPQWRLSLQTHRLLGIQ